ncbi:MAG: HEAT repeat domain-containing protein [Bdellovibrionota bacterium]
MSAQQPPRPGSPAASHMLLFFVIPCLGFILWASWGLIGGLLEKKPQDVPARIEAVKKARSSGDRWQAVYALSQELQRMKSRGEWETKVSPEQKKQLFDSLVGMEQEHATDLRFKKYVLLTLAQFGSVDVLPAISAELKTTDPEIRFYAAWAYIELLSKNESARSPDTVAPVRAWLGDEDASFRKISATFLVQFDLENSRKDIEKLLQDKDQEVRWNTAVALSSVGDQGAVSTLKEMFNLSEIRKMDLRSLEDLKQLLASAYEAARKLGNEDVLTEAKKLKGLVDPSTPEGAAIHEALGGA